MTSNLQASLTRNVINLVNELTLIKPKFKKKKKLTKTELFFQTSYMEISLTFQYFPSSIIAHRNSSFVRI